jgi:phospholipid-translocating ATPase
MSLLKRRPSAGSSDDEREHTLDGIDPELRLRTVRTAHSAIAESIVADERQTRRRRRFFRLRAEKGKQGQGLDEDPEKAKAAGRGKPEGKRRNVYVNTPLPRAEVDSKGDPLVRYPRNKVRTTSAYLVFFLVFLLIVLMLHRRIHIADLPAEESIRAIPPRR